MYVINYNPPRKLQGRKMRILPGFYQVFRASLGDVPRTERSATGATLEEALKNLK
jgi:hypothetical protein